MDADVESLKQQLQVVPVGFMHPLADRREHLRDVLVQHLGIGTGLAL